MKSVSSTERALASKGSPLEKLEMRNKSGLSKRSVLLVTFAFIFSLFICMSCDLPDAMGGKGSVTIRVGGESGNGRVAWCGVETDDLILTITVKNGPGPEQTKLAINYQAQFTLVPGTWDIIVKAYHTEDDAINGLNAVAEGKLPAQNLKPGPNNLDENELNMEPTEDAACTVAFVTNGGGDIAPQTIIKGGKATKPDTPTMDGFTFGGWYIDDETLWNFENDTATDNITLYARWIDVAVYCTVTFDINGATNGDAPTMEPVPAGSEITLPDGSGFEKDGHTFNGWYTESDGESLNAGDLYTVETAVTFFADWKQDSPVITDPICECPNGTVHPYGEFCNCDGIDCTCTEADPTYTVTFRADGGTPEPQTQTVTSGGTATKPDTPTMDGFTFGGWYTDDETLWNFENDTVTANTILFAKWIKKITITISDSDDKTLSPIEDVVFTVTISGLPTGADISDFEFNVTYVTYNGYPVDKGNGTFTNIETIKTSTPNQTQKSFNIKFAWHEDHPLSPGGYFINFEVKIPNAFQEGYHFLSDNFSVRFKVADGATSASPIPVKQSNIQRFINYFKNDSEAQLWSSLNIKLSQSFILEEDVSLKGIAWTPIGDSDDYPFTGTFDGDGNTIRDLKIDAPNSDYQGLFGYVRGGEVMDSGKVSNLGLVDCDITGYAYVGGIAGFVANYTDSYYGTTFIGTVQNCYVTGSVTGNNTVGGIVGENNGGTITRCYVTDTTVEGADYVGGITSANYGTITNCYSTATVTGGSSVGGIAASQYSGIINYCYATGNVTGESYVGGIAGQKDSGTISNCVALNEKIISSDYNSTGRVIGRDISSTASPPIGCYADEAMSVTVNGISVTSFADPKNGGDAIEDEFTDPEWWSDTVGFNFGTDEDSPWEWNTTTNRPKLWFVDEEQP